MKKTRLILLYLIISLFIALLVTPSWLINQFGEMNFEQILFLLFSNGDGANTDIVAHYIEYLSGYLLVFSLLYLVFIFLFHFRFSISITLFKKRMKLILNGKIRRRTLIIISIICLIIATTNAFYKLNIIQYIEGQVNAGTLYEDYYVSPDNASLTFPETKQNLIYIFLESMQTGFNNVTIDGEVVNLIPNLEYLAQENISFSNTDSFGGALAGYNLNWTVASLVGQTSGVPLAVPISGNDYGQNGSFLPGLTTLGEILEDEGYQNYFLLGSDATFGGRSTYFETHGNYQIIDYYERIESGVLPADYLEFWGFEDQKLFEYAKDILIEVSQDNNPFNLTILTVDTHFMDGYTDDECDLPYSIAYANAIACSDKKLGNFIAWIQEQSFYENTTIILSGDHQTMNSQFTSLIVDDYSSSTYNVIINSQSVPVSEYNRDFIAVDMFPTTLAALGVDIEDDRLGLGTNLFSNRKTLVEELGYVEMTLELSKKSHYYDNYFFNYKDVD